MRLTTTREILLCACALFIGCVQVTDPLAHSDASVANDTTMGTTNGSAGKGGDPGLGTAGTFGNMVGAGGGSANGTGTDFGGCFYQGANGADSCLNVYSMDKSGKGCQLFISPTGVSVCAPDTWGCTATEKGDAYCYDTSGGIAGSGTMAGYAGNGGGPVDAGLPDDCGCDDGNACTLDVCDPATKKCYHKSVATMTDADKDGVSDGCDCDDANTTVHPGATSFSDGPFIFSGIGAPTALIKGQLSYDYDCDGSETPKYTALASTCSLWAEGQEICLGEGWSDPKVPQCGTGGAYQVCAFDSTKKACEPTTIMLQQACR